MDKSGAEQVASDRHVHSTRRRRRRHHHQHEKSLQKRSGRGVEIAFVTLLALAILFGVLYLLLPRDQRRMSGEESSLVPPSSEPAPRGHGRASGDRGPVFEPLAFSSSSFSSFFST